MGAEAKTTLTVGRDTFAGTAHLESTDVRFRGETKLNIALRTNTAEKLVTPRASR